MSRSSSQETALQFDTAPLKPSGLEARSMEHFHAEVTFDFSEAPKDLL